VTCFLHSDALTSSVGQLTMTAPKIVFLNVEEEAHVEAPLATAG
jgi:hypothetical protein